MAVLHGEILRCIKQVESLDARLQREDRYVKDATKKIEVCTVSETLFVRLLDLCYHTLMG